MRANRVYLNEVAAKVATMTQDKGLAYLRGASSVKGNTATTNELLQMFANLAPVPVAEIPKKVVEKKKTVDHLFDGKEWEDSSFLKTDTVENEKANVKKQAASRKIRRKSF